MRLNSNEHLRWTDTDEREAEPPSARLLHGHALLRGLVLRVAEHRIVGERLFLVALARGPVFRVDVFF